jgi:tripartite-type tricarboxylate transporter receptor subunit TctC
VTVRRRGLLAGFSAASALVLSRSVPAVQPVRAVQPDRHVTLLLGFAKGTAADRAARTFLGFLAPRLSGTDIRVSNLPGEAGHTMLAALGSAPSDGTTIGWVLTPVLPARMIDRRDPALGQRIYLLAQVEREPIAFVSLSSDPANSIQDIIQRASDDADAVPLGTPPAGSPPHLAALRLQRLAQTQLSIVTFPSSQAARQALLDGNVSAAALGLSEAIDALRDGDLSAIGITARRRFGLLPDTPVLDESRFPLSAFIRRGVAVPAGTPPDAIAPLVEAIRAAADDSAFADKAEANGYIATWTDGSNWLAQVQAEQALLTQLWETNPWLSSSGG